MKIFYDHCVGLLYFASYFQNDARGTSKKLLG